MIVAVSQQERESVALRQAESAECDGEAIDPIVELRKTETEVSANHRSFSGVSFRVACD
jgi:hypothetical protein